MQRFCGCEGSGSVSEKNFTTHAILRYIGVITRVQMGEFIEIGSGGFPLELMSGLFCAIALGLFALLQPASDDDDSNGGGGGGLMQPIA